MSDPDPAADPDRGGTSGTGTAAAGASQSHRALLAHMRHELRTPLIAIIGYSEMLLEDAAEDGEPSEGGIVPELQRICAAGKQLLARINDLLDPATVEAQRHELDLERMGGHIRHELRTPLNAILGYSELLLEEAEDRGQAASTPELAKIHAAGQQLLALVDNIVRFSEIEAGGREVDLAAEQVSALAHDVVSSIPALVGAADRVALEAHILVADDNEINRDLLARRLEREGYTAALAENGRQALEMVRSQPFDLVLLDVMMPELNGYQVLEAVKADPEYRHLPVIMISALDEIDSVVRCIEAGAEDYLSKPFNPTLLRARIGASLEKKRLRDREQLYLQQIEEEKRRSDELLHVILPHEIVKELKATNSVRPRLYENVGVLFCDIVDFTPYCEGRPPEEVIPNLQQLVAKQEELALRYEMQKIKTIGDSFMATAGLLRPVESPVLTCVRCGLDMAAAARNLPAKWQVRVGIHVGPVVAGVVGHRQYLFDLWGDAVNTAARVESHGANDAVNLSRDAWLQVANQVHGRSQGLIPVKGKGQMEIFRVDGLR